MKLGLFALILALPLTLSLSASASTGITINGAELGVGKFHRKDNSVHPYAADNAWKPYVLAQGTTTTPAVQNNADGSFSIFFSTLDEFMTAAEKISADQHKPISVININGHGTPGAMWFPKDEKTRKSLGCMSWRASAAAADESNYSQYYSQVSKSEIMQIRALSNSSSASASCTTGLKEWQDVFANHPAFKAALASDLQVHLLSCVVGLGKLGDTFTKGLAKLLLTTDSGRVQTSVMFGLGDWSMPEGMGFWDYQNDAQLARDNTNYPVHRSDREQMQKGTIRVAGLLNNQIASNTIENQDFMFLDDRAPGILSSTREEIFEAVPAEFKNLDSVRIIGTNVRAKVTY